MPGRAAAVACAALLALGLAGCATLDAPRSTRLDDTPRLVLMSASEPELRVLAAGAEITDSLRLVGRTVVLGRLEGVEVAFALSGVSMVNAALNAQALVDHLTVRGILFSGVAGGVSPTLGLGDVVVPAEWAQYQEGVYARREGRDWVVPEGFTDLFGRYGMMFPQPVEIPGANGTESIFWFEVDPDLLRAAREAAATVVLRDCAMIVRRPAASDIVAADSVRMDSAAVDTVGADSTVVGSRVAEAPTGEAEEVCLEEAPEIRVGGRGVSGPTFVDNAEYRKWVWSTFNADALDMESAAVAHVAYANDVPFLAVRALSDLAGAQTDPDAYRVFLDFAADNAASFVTALLRAYAAHAIR